MDLALPELLNVLTQKMKSLNVGHPTLFVAAVVDRLSRDLAWTSDTIEGTALKGSEARGFDFTKAQQQPERLDDDRLEFLHHWQTVQSLVLPLAVTPLQRLNVAFMKQLHRHLAITTVSEQELGRYRSKRVTVRGTTNPGFTEPRKISEECDAMFEQLYSLAFSHPVEPRGCIPRLSRSTPSSTATVSGGSSAAERSAGAVWLSTNVHSAGE